MNWHNTDIDVLQRHGAEVDDHGAYRVFRFPACPSFHWGHFIEVTEPGSATDAAELSRWVDTFKRHFPDADWISILLPEQPNLAACEQLGLDYDPEVELVADTPLEHRALPEGYSVRPLDGDDDWAAWEELRLATSGATEPEALEGWLQFNREQQAWHRRAQREGTLQRFGAFDEHGQLCSSVGIFPLGDRGRFNNVSTAEQHRRQGLASHLLSVADEWCRQQGSRVTAIVADAGSEAERLYRSLGFRPAGEHHQVGA